jgi:hypothetical protein
MKEISLIWDRSHRSRAYRVLDLLCRWHCHCLEIYISSGRYPCSHPDTQTFSSSAVPVMSRKSISLRRLSTNPSKRRGAGRPRLLALIKGPKIPCSGWHVCHLF